MGWAETCQLFQLCECYAHQPAPLLMHRDAGGAGTVVRAPSLVFLCSVALKRQWFASQDFSLMHELSPHICLVNSGLTNFCVLSDLSACVKVILQQALTHTRIMPGCLSVSVLTVTQIYVQRVRFEATEVHMSVYLSVFACTCAMHACDR